MAIEAKSVEVTGEPEGHEQNPLEAIGFDPDDAMKKLVGFARENPHTALAGALCVGFLLGGGLSPRLLGTFAALAGRKYLDAAIREAVESALRA